MIASSIESNLEEAFISERVDEGIAAGKSVFSGRCKCICNLPLYLGLRLWKMDTPSELLRGNW